MIAGMLLGAMIFLIGWLIGFVVGANSAKSIEEE